MALENAGSGAASAAVVDGVDLDAALAAAERAARAAGALIAAAWGSDAARTAVTKSSHVDLVTGELVFFEERVCDGPHSAPPFASIHAATVKHITRHTTTPQTTQHNTQHNTQTTQQTTETDKKAEEAIRAILAEAFPSFKFIGEEEAAEAGGAVAITDAPTWMVRALLLLPGSPGRPASAGEPTGRRGTQQAPCAVGIPLTPSPLPPACTPLKTPPQICVESKTTARGGSNSNRHARSTHSTARPTLCTASPSAASVSASRSSSGRSRASSSTRS